MKALLPLFLIGSTFLSSAQANQYNHDLTFSYENIDNSIDQQSFFMLVHLDESMPNHGPLGQRNFLNKSDFVVASRSHYSYTATDTRSHAVEQYMEYGWEISDNKYLSIAYDDSMTHYKPSQNWAPRSRQGYGITYAQYVDDNTALGINYSYSQDDRADDGNLLKGFYNRLFSYENGTYLKINTTVSTVKYASNSSKNDSNFVYFGAIYYPTTDWGFGFGTSRQDYDDDTTHIDYDANLSHFLNDSTYIGVNYSHVLPTSGSSYSTYNVKIGKRF